MIKPYVPLSIMPVFGSDVDIGASKMPAMGAESC